MATKRVMMASEIDAIIKKLEAYLADLKKQWDVQKLPAPSWWKLNRVRMATGTSFIIDSLDKLVQFVEGLIPAGTDKKAAVVTLLDKLFDYVITPCLPIWLRPFAPIIKDVLINFLIGNMIEFVVAKYNKGIWKKDVNNATLKATYYLPRTRR